MKRIPLGIALSAAIVGSVACGSDSQGPLDGVDSIVFIQRPRRDAGRDIFQYTSYLPTARLVSLSPPTADGTLTELCCSKYGAEYADIDIGSYDLSFDAREIVMSARLSADQNYGLFVLSLDNDTIEQLPTDPNRDYVYPIFAPGDKIIFVTNKSAEDGAPQFRDEYERGTTTQLGYINRDGSGETLGARNLSHRVFPTLLSDGRIMITQWDHLGSDNAGRLMILNPDLSTAREGFGKEGTGITNSYFRAHEIAPGRVVAIGSARDRTLQSGTILDIRLGEVSQQDGIVRADTKMAEHNASYEILTPQVPLGREPSAATIGRYYDAYPLNAKEKPDFLVSWADGPVNSEILEAAGVTADFGVYLYDSKKGARKPIWNDENYWDVEPRPMVPRTAPPKIESAGKHQYGADKVLVGSMNVYDSTLATFDPGSVYGVRVIEGFSVEEGVPNDFGLSRFEGAAMLGVVPVQEDGSWAALVPAGIPFHLQAIDKFGVALKSEPVWISGNPGESRFCGGCHEDRAATTVIQPGITEAVAIGPKDLQSAVARNDRASFDFSVNGTVGIPWDQALQPIFDAKCVSCHDGTPGPANPSYTIMDSVTGESQTITFDLRGQSVTYGVGADILTGYSASHLSLLGPSMEKIEKTNLVIVGDPPTYVEPGSARDSMLIQKLNPMQLYPTPNTSVRAFATTPHGQEQGFTLTPDEMALLVRMCDFGGQFYSRENAPGGAYGM